MRSVLPIMLMSFSLFPVYSVSFPPKRCATIRIPVVKRINFEFFRKRCLNNRIPHAKLTKWTGEMYEEVTKRRSFHGDTLRLLCDNQYTYEGGGLKSVNLTCYKGHWKPTPVCNRKRCEDPPPPIEHGIIKSYSTNHNSTVEYECEEGFAMKIQKMFEVRCLFGEWKGNPPKCRNNRCYKRSLEKTRGLKMDDSFIASGEYMDIKCKKGFTAVKDSQPYCCEGVWIQQYPPCQEKRCKDKPPSIEHGAYLPYSADHNSTVEYVCEEGFLMQNPKSYEIRCLFGEWKGDPPYCKSKRCEDEPPPIEHGAYLLYSEDHNSTVEYVCEEGFVMQNPKSHEIRCFFGEWKGDLPYCKSNRCYKRDLQKNKGLKMDDSFISSGDYMDIDCMEGFTAVKGVKPYCSEGNWIQHYSPCLEKICEDEPPPIEHGVFMDYDGDHNSTVEYECEEGFVMEDPKSYEVRCLFGEWKGVPPNCRKKRCEYEPPPIEHGAYLPYSADHNSTVEYECEEGFALKVHYSSQVRCLFGEWKGDPPYCKNTRCYKRSLAMNRGLEIDEGFIASGEFMDVNCKEGFMIVKDSEPYCSEGVWIQHVSPCREIFKDRCYNQVLQQTPGLLLDDGITRSGDYMNVKCMEGYTIVNDSKPFCSQGIWIQFYHPCEEICGERPIEMDNQKDPFEPFVVGGTDAKQDAWPWMVSIYSELESESGKYEYVCGGSVLSLTLVLSVAHCYKEGNKFAVRWGSDNVSSPVTLEDEGVLEVLKVYIPDQYRVRKHYFDIAIFSVKGRMDTPPICLPHRLQIFEVQLNATITGWGRTSYGGDVSPRLQEAELQVVDQASCKEIFAKSSPTSLSTGIDDSMICAYAEGKDTCQGDSGSPLVTLMEDGRWVQVGVMSFSFGCAVPGFPAVYSRVTSHVDWIRRTIWLSYNTRED